MGEIQIRDNTNGVLFAGGFASVEITTSVEINKAKRLNTAGSLIISDSYAGLSESELKITQEVSDSLHDGLALGELPKSISSTSYYDYVDTVVPTTSPYEVPLLGVTTALANTSSVLVTMFQSGSWNGISTGQKPLNLTRTSSAPTDGQFQVNTTTVGAEKLVFNAAQAGAPIIISYLRTVTNKLSIGLASAPVGLPGLYFSAKLISDEYPNGAILICPSITKTSGFAYKTGAVPVIENTFQLGTPAGYRIPVNMIYL